MFRSNRVEPTILEEDADESPKHADLVVPFESELKVDMPSSARRPSVPLTPNTPTSGNTPTNGAGSAAATPTGTSLTAKRPSLAGESGRERRSSSVHYIMDRMQSKLRKMSSLDARKQLFQTQKFFTPFKRWIYGFYNRRWEPEVELALSDLRDNKSGAWIMHPKTMCCVHIIQTQMVIHRKASMYRILETYFLTALPLWGTFLFQGSIVYYLWWYLRETPVPDTGFCSNSFLLQLSTLVVFIMITVVENTARFEANALVAISPLYGRLPNAKKFDLEGGEVKTGLHSLIMKRHFGEFMRSDAHIAVKIIYLFTLCSVVFDVWIFLVISYVGSKYIATSAGVSDIIQSAVALSFIWSLGDVVFNQTYSESIVEDLMSIHILVPTNESDWENVPDPAVHKQPHKHFAGVAYQAMQEHKHQLHQPQHPPHHPALPPSAFNHSTSGMSTSSSTANGSVNGGGSEGSAPEDECLDEHILFQNNNLIYNAFFVMTLIVVPIFVTGVLIPTRMHYCGHFDW